MSTLSQAQPGMFQKHLQTKQLEQHLNVPQCKPGAQPKCSCLWTHFEDVIMEIILSSSRAGQQLSLVSQTFCIAMLWPIVWIEAHESFVDLLLMLASLALWRRAERKIGTRESVLARYPSVGKSKSQTLLYCKILCRARVWDPDHVLRGRRNISLCFQFSTVH